MILEIFSKIVKNFPEATVAPRLKHSFIAFLFDFDQKYIKFTVMTFLIKVQFSTFIVIVVHFRDFFSMFLKYKEYEI